MPEETGNITLPGNALPKETHPVVCVPAQCPETPVVSVTSSHQGVYRVCKRITDFFYTVHAELWHAVRELCSLRRFFRGRERRNIPAACCGYSRTVLGWRL